MKKKKKIIDTNNLMSEFEEAIAERLKSLRKATLTIHDLKKKFWWHLIERLQIVTFKNCVTVSLMESIPIRERYN